MGHVLSGTLRLVRKIADGGMGSVWIAQHLVLDTEVAVKFMSGPWAGVPSARSRFLREARITAKIDSPHVVRVLDCRHNEADEPYLVLELLQGETLEQRVRRHGPMSVFEVVEIISQTCEALAATHDARIVHRDLKPENVFLVAGGSTFVKLLDYGVAKPMSRVDCLEADHLSAGTPQYMSPEHMFEPDTTDARSDLFSLGAVAYFALTRRTPFDADSIVGLYFAIDGGTFARPSQLRPELPPALDCWFEKALAHDPKDRFHSARQMADALFDASRTMHVVEPEAEPAEATPSSDAVAHPTLSELEVPVRRLRRSRESAFVALALAAAATVFAWRGAGPEVHEASASMKSELADASADVRAPSLEPYGSGTVRPESGACGTIEADPAQLGAAAHGILAAAPRAEPGRPLLARPPP